jgi:hypothetical protein
VKAIIKAVRFAGGGRRIRVWSTDGVFVDPEEAARDYLKVASANWHALATFSGRYAPHGESVLIDIGSSTTDIIPLKGGRPASKGRIDLERLEEYELVYVGVRRTPVSTVMSIGTCAELFATTQDVFLVVGPLQEDVECLDTADGRPFTRQYSLTRLARMLGGDGELISEFEICRFADMLKNMIAASVSDALARVFLDRGKSLPRTVIAAGAGEFLVGYMLEVWFPPRYPERTREIECVISLGAELGSEVSACAPAYAVAVLASEAKS